MELFTNTFIFNVTIIFNNIKPILFLLSYYRWSITDWSPCSVSCGLGVQTREMACRQQINPTLTMNVDESACPSPMPANVILSKACQRPPCDSIQSDGTSHWIAGTWSKVSVLTTSPNSSAF